MSKVIWNGKLWDFEDLPHSVQERVNGSLIERDFERYTMNKQISGYEKMLDGQNRGDRTPGEYESARGKARRDYWSGVSSEMNA